MLTEIAVELVERGADHGALHFDHRVDRVGASLYLDQSSGIFGGLLHRHIGFDRRRQQLADGFGKLLEELAREPGTIDLWNAGKGPDAFLHRASRTQSTRVPLSFRMRHSQAGPRIRLPLGTCLAYLGLVIVTGKNVIPIGSARQALRRQERTDPDGCSRVTVVSYPRGDAWKLGPGKLPRRGHREALTVELRDQFGEMPRPTAAVRRSAASRW